MFISWKDRDSGWCYTLMPVTDIRVYKRKIWFSVHGVKNWMATDGYETNSGARLDPLYSSEKTTVLERYGDYIFLVPITEYTLNNIQCDVRDGLDSINRLTQHFNNTREAAMFVERMVLRHNLMPFSCSNIIEIPFYAVALSAMMC